MTLQHLVLKINFMQNLTWTIIRSRVETGVVCHVLNLFGVSVAYLASLGNTLLILIHTLGHGLMHLMLLYRVGNCSLLPRILNIKSSFC